MREGALHQLCAVVRPVLLAGAAAVGWAVFTSGPANADGGAFIQPPTVIPGTAVTAGPAETGKAVSAAVAKPLSVARRVPSTPPATHLLTTKARSGAHTTPAAGATEVPDLPEVKAVPSRVDQPVRASVRPVTQGLKKELSAPRLATDGAVAVSRLKESALPSRSLDPSSLVERVVTMASRSAQALVTEPVLSGVLPLPLPTSPAPADNPWEPSSTPALARTGLVGLAAVTSEDPKAEAHRLASALATALSAAPTSLASSSGPAPLGSAATGTAAPPIDPPAPAAPPGGVGSTSTEGSASRSWGHDTLGRREAGLGAPPDSRCHVSREPGSAMPSSPTFNPGFFPD